MDISLVGRFKFCCWYLYRQTACISVEGLLSKVPVGHLSSFVLLLYPCQVKTSEKLVWASSSKSVKTAFLWNLLKDFRDSERQSCWTFYAAQFDILKVLTPFTDVKIWVKFPFWAATQNWENLLISCRCWFLPRLSERLDRALNALSTDPTCIWIVWGSLRYKRSSVWKLSLWWINIKQKYS